jgi:hypothetical protein
MTTRNRTLPHRTLRHSTLRSVAPFAAGVLIGLSVVTPVFAATLDVNRLQPLVLVGSLVILLVGLALKAVATPKHASRQPGADEGKEISKTDLRLQPTESAMMDVPLPRTSLR